MNVNKNGIPIQAPKKTHKRKPLNIKLKMRRFRLIDKEADVEVVVPHFSPVIKELKKDGWREIK